MVYHPSSPDDITPQWLTNCLTTPVQATEIIWHDPIKAWSGTLTPMQITYSDVSSSAPKNLIFKQWHSTWAEVAAHELYFYTSIAPQMPQIRSPYLYYEHHTETSACAIYEDFSVSYQQLNVRKLPSISKTKRVISTLAQLHAIWWDKPLLQDAHLTQMQGGPLCMAHLSSTDVLQQYDKLIREKAPQYVKAFDIDIPQSWRNAFEWAVEHWYKIVSKRASKNQHLTLIHGDIHWGNIAFHTSNPDILLFDWETFKRGLGAFDVAYFIHDRYWQEERKLHEVTLLRHYHDTLLRQGVRYYLWDDFMADYRLSLVLLLLVHLQWRGLGLSHSTVFIQDAIDGFEMWDCRKTLV